MDYVARAIELMEEGLTEEANELFKYFDEYDYDRFYKYTGIDLKAL